MVSLPAVARYDDQVMPAQIVIERRFHGPPESGNGGYVAGRLAAYVNGRAIVRLRTPPPLDVAMSVRRDGDEVLLVDGDTVVATAKPASLDYAPPSAPAFSEAEHASKGYVGFTTHVFPTCFVCGPRRETGDGLRVFPGRVNGGGRVAAPWIPQAEFAGAGGTVAPEFVWAVLDCPGAFSFRSPLETPVLLGELAVEISGTVVPGERCVITAVELGHEGRKHRTATMLYGEAGDCRAIGLATWIELPPR